MTGDLEKYDRIGEHKMDMRMAEDAYSRGVTLCAFCGRPFGDSIGIDGMCLDCTHHEFASEVGGEFDLRKLILARLEPDDPYEIGDDPWQNFLITVELFGIGLEESLEYHKRRTV